MVQRADPSRHAPGVGTHAVESIHQKLSERARVAFGEHLGKRLQRHALGGACAAVRESYLDEKRIAAVNRRRARGRDVELARHHRVQTL